MLQYLTLEELKDIIEKAQALHGSRPSSPGGIDVGSVDVFAMIATYAEESRPLRTSLDALSNDAMREIKALMWLGRGDFRTWAEALAEAATHAPDREGDVVYVSEKSPLAKYLRHGAKLIHLAL